MATWDGPDLSSPKLILPTGVSVWPAMENTETVPSERLATSASVPARLIDTPAAPLPACNCAKTLGGEALRSITESLSSGTVFFGSAGSILDAAVTSAKLSSRATATLSGGPITLVGASISATTLGGFALRSMSVTVSRGGLAGTEFTPSVSTAVPALAETASWPLAPDDNETTAASESTPTKGIWRCMRTSRCADRCDFPKAPRTRRHSIIRTDCAKPPLGLDGEAGADRCSSDQRPAAAGNGRALAVRSALSRSASRNARSIDCSALSRGSHTV